MSLTEVNQLPKAYITEITSSWSIESWGKQIQFFLNNEGESKSDFAVIIVEQRWLLTVHFLHLDQHIYNLQNPIQDDSQVQLVRLEP